MADKVSGTVPECAQSARQAKPLSDDALHMSAERTHSGSVQCGTGYQTAGSIVDQETNVRTAGVARECGRVERPLVAAVGIVQEVEDTGHPEVPISC